MYADKIKNIVVITLSALSFIVAPVVNAKNSLIKQPPAIYSSYQIAQPYWAENGMVSSQEAMATNVGVAILKQGGNAVDAAVAVGFSLAVTYPRAGNIGGGGFMMVYIAKEKKTIAIDYREMAPAAAHKDIFLDENGDVDNQKARFHGLSSGVPGTVMGLELALKEYGSMTLAQVMQPAIDQAEKGIVVTRGLSGSLSAMKERLSRWQSTKEIFYPNKGQSLEIGQRFYQPELANSLKLIAKQGSKGFYQGVTASKIASAVQEAGGVMTVADLANYKAKIRHPITGTYRGYEIISMPPPSSGGIHLVQILNILENYPIGKWGHNSANTIHVMSEAMKRAYADRSEYLGDDDYVSVPMKALTNKAYANSIAKQIDIKRATPSELIKPGKLAPYESPQTTHFSVVDKWGNAVANTYTLNFSYGSGLIAAGTGIFMNNEMDDFSSKPGVPNGYGLLGGTANAIEPMKRPLSAMTPTIVLKNGELFLVTGTPGGSRIITTTLQIVMNVIDHQMNIAEATNATRIHHQWYPDEIRVERGLSIDTIKLLEAKGHKIHLKASMGSTQSIMKTEQGLFGATDPRSKAGKVSGY
jgi:gamma-glutamyltranspeptidase/glutathione hydrolase